MGYRHIIDFGLVIAVLNMFDGWATHYGLTKNLIVEANPIMRILAEIHPALFLGVKFILSIFIFIVSCLVYLKSRRTFKRFYFYSLTGASVLYIGICFMHLYWLFIYSFGNPAVI